MGTGRLVGLDVARCVALLGMVATHVLDERTPSGELAFGHSLAAGRSSALFALLAGVTLALSSGGRSPVQGRERAAASAGLAVRALLIAGIGLFLGELQSGLAVILTYYGVLFLVGLPFLGLRAPALVALSAVVLAAGPVASHVLRPLAPERGFASPSLRQLVEDPDGMLWELLLTGYYPVLPWLAYLLAGMALGRLDLSGRRTPVTLASLGLVLAVASALVSRVLTGDTVGGRPLDEVATGLTGTPPTGGSWEWLLVVVPHSGTPFDLAHTTGTALVVIGLALLLVDLVGGVGVRTVAVLFGAGTMTLTLYSLHVFTRSPGLLPEALVDSYLFHVVLLLGVGAGYVAAGQRGPLERLVGAAAGATRRAIGSAS